MVFSDSPTHLSPMVAGLRASMCAPVARATARASSVLPVPGGPYNSAPVVRIWDMRNLEAAAGRSCDR